MRFIQKKIWAEDLRDGFGKIDKTVVELAVLFC